VPHEAEWFANIDNPRTRRAYRIDIHEFMGFVGIPESVIRQKLAEIKQGGAHSPAKVFTSALKAYATAVLQKKDRSSLMSPRKDLFRI
jgi:hypothetical protein